MQASWNTLCHLVVGSSFDCHSLWFSAFCRELLGVMCSSWNFTECWAYLFHVGALAVESPWQKHFLVLRFSECDYGVVVFYSL